MEIKSGKEKKNGRGRKNAVFYSYHLEEKVGRFFFVVNISFVMSNPFLNYGKKKRGCCMIIAVAWAVDPTSPGLHEPPVRFCHWMSTHCHT